MQLRRTRPLRISVLAGLGLVTVSSVLAGCTPAQPRPLSSATSGAFDPALVEHTAAVAGVGTVFSALLARDVAADPSLASISGVGAALDRVAAQLYRAGATSAGSSTPSAASPGPTAGGARGAGGGSAEATTYRRPTGVRAPAAVTGGGGDLLGVGLGVGSMAGAVGGITDRPATVSRSETTDGATVEGTMTMSAQGMEFTMDVTKDGVHYTKSVKGHASGNLCPDGDGTVVATLEFSTGQGAGGVGVGLSLHATATGTVDDAARLAALTVDGDEQAYADGSSGRTSVVQHVSSASSGLADGKATGTVSVTTTMAAGVSDADAYAGQGAAARDVERFAYGVMLGWQDVWRGGRCVKLTADLPKTVDASTSTPFQVSAKDSSGGSIQVPVKASLSAGGVSVSPESATTTASLTYRSPDGYDKSASVELESVSRRGIGHTSAQVTTMRKNYTATASTGGLQFDGFYERGGPSFVMGVEFPGGEGTFRYTATSADQMSGTLTVESAGSGATATGSGTWTITPNDDGTLTLTEHVHACVDVSGVCNDTTQTVTLTPN